MVRSNWTAILVAVLAIGIPRPVSLSAQEAWDFAGRWTLNGALSESPGEIGFAVDWMPTGGTDPDSGGGSGKGRRGSRRGGAGGFTARRESEDDSKRVRQLTAEARNPSAHLTIVETSTAITITDDRGQSRTFHPNGKEEALQLDGVPVGVTAKREAGRLVVDYDVEQGRKLRYTYSPAANRSQLVVELQFIERGGGDRVRRVYEPSTASETQPADNKAIVPAGSAVSSGKAGSLAPADRIPAQPLNRKPDAELKGLTKLGVVVEDLSPQAVTCGLNQGALETAVSKRLSDAGFSVRRNSDEDTYVYVNVITTSLPNGLCVSRYDAFLYTHTTAKLTYQETPVLVQVSLLHKGGIAGGASASHAEAVLRGVQEYVDQFSTRIRDANK
jgi:hypothetical protein